MTAAIFEHFHCAKPGTSLTTLLALCHLILTAALCLPVINITSVYQHFIFFFLKGATRDG